MNAKILRWAIAFPASASHNCDSTYQAKDRKIVPKDGVTSFLKGAVVNRLMLAERITSQERGQLVEVIDGPLAGVRGTLIRVRDGTARIMLGQPEQGAFLIMDAENISLVR